MRRALDDQGVVDAEIGERRRRAPGKRLVRFDANHHFAHARQDGGGIAGAAADHQGDLAGFRCRRLDQPRQNHRLHQEAAAAKRQIFVDIGQRTPLGPNEPLARQRRQRADQRRIGDLVGANLALHHIRPGCGEIGHYASDTANSNAAAGLPARCGMDL